MIGGTSSATGVQPEAARPPRPAIEFTRMRSDAVAAVRFGSAQPKASTSGLRKIPPPVPVTPAARPIAAPATSRTPMRASRVVSVPRVLARLVHAMRTAAIASDTPIAARNQSAGSGSVPPRNAAGTEATANGHQKRHEKCPAVA